MGFYGRRYAQMLHKFAHERLYDAASLLASPGNGGIRGAFVEPTEDLSMKRLLSSLLGHVGGYLAGSKVRSCDAGGISS